MIYSRRRFLLGAGRLAMAGIMMGAGVGCVTQQQRRLRAIAGREAGGFSSEDLVLLDELERTGCRYFWEASHPETGLTKDRSLADGPDPRPVSSVAAIGFGLTACCIGAERGFLDAAGARERVRATLRHLWNRQPHVRGFFYHFIHWETGERVWNCELSSIDTALLVCGVIFCGEYFDDPEIRQLARAIYQRVDWRWMLNGGPTLSHGWKPESGFLENRWDHYCELKLLYLLALGSPTHPIPADAWHAWARPEYEHYDFRYIGSPAPLFVHQYSHAWFDFRGRSDSYTDYFLNSIIATEVHRRFCIELGHRYPHFGADLWGITASDSAHGYTAWGGPPEMGKLDGTLVPCAAAGSIPFLPRATLHTLKEMRLRFGGQVWKRYGFVDAFNPHTGWINPDVIGIDVGISLLMAENARTGFVWDHFMRNDAVQRGMNRAGFSS